MSIWDLTIEESGGVNLYGFVGNRGVNRFDVLGLLEIEIKSSYLDENGNPKDADGVWKQAHETTIAYLEGKPIDLERPALLHDYLSAWVGGVTNQDVQAKVFIDPDEESGCKVKADIYHYVARILMNDSPTRSLKISRDYWGHAHHEVMHIQATLRRIKFIVEMASSWPDVTETPEQALDLVSSYQEKLDGLIKQHRDDEFDHDTSGGFGTPAAHKPYGGWGGWIPNENKNQ